MREMNSELPPLTNSLVSGLRSERQLGRQRSAQENLDLVQMRLNKRRKIGSPSPKKISQRITTPHKF
jgi:hypothetical protein